MYALYKAGSLVFTTAACLLVGAVVALDYQKTSLSTRSALIDHNESSILSRTNGLTTAIRSVVPDSSASSSDLRDSSATKPSRSSTDARSKRIAKTGTNERLGVAEKGSWQLSDRNGLAAQRSSPRGERKGEHQRIGSSRSAGIALYLWILAGAAHRPPTRE
jgi:hypothetical protein